MKRKSRSTWIVVTAGLVAASFGQGCGDDMDDPEQQEANQTCSFMGEEYETGELFPAGDGCNSCMCNPNGDRPGEYECTGRACADCSICSDTELCVVSFDGACLETGVKCVSTQCDETCTTECDAELCDSPTTCDAPSCLFVPDGAFGCFGP